MNEEVKEAIKKLYFLFNECEPVVDFETDEKLYREKSREQLESHNTVLNLIEKQDKIINEMAEQLTTPLHSKEWIIDYYKKEISSE